MERESQENLYCQRDLMMMIYGQTLQPFRLELMDGFTKITWNQDTYQETWKDLNKII